MAMLVEVREKWYDILVELLECPVCYEITTDYIYQCLSGHHICRMCRGKLKECPTCQNIFAGTRNYVAEALSHTLEDIMISLKYPAHHITRRILKNKMCAYTQTQEICKVSVGTQIQEIYKTSIGTQAKDILLNENKSTQTENAEVHKQNKGTKDKKQKRKLHYPRVKKGNYPCCIGSCIASLPYGKMIEHIQFSHKDAFYILQEHKGIFRKNVKLQYIVPKDYDFALFIKNMGLFFLNITILSTGDLTGAVYVVNNASASKHFTFVLTIGKGEKATIYCGVVKSCRDSSKQTMENCLYKKNVEMNQILLNNGKFNSSVMIKHSNPKEEPQSH